MLKIEIWSDYACPYCYIGKRRLEEALQTFEHRDNVEIILRSYQLAPDAERDIGLNMYEGLAAKYQISVEQAMENTRKTAEQAEAFNIEMNFDRVVQTNTMDAHRLTHYAAEQNKSLAIAERLMKAYFTDGLHIGDHDVLLDLAVETGLDQDSVSRLLASTDFADTVRKEREQGLQTGLKMIPHILINGQYVYFGGQPSEVVLEALQKAWHDDATDASLTEKDETTFAEGCTEEGCVIPPART